MDLQALTVENESLRRQLAERYAEDVETKAEAAENSANADREREKRIEFEAEQFALLVKDANPAATLALRSLFVSAKKNDDAKAVVDLETIAASLAAQTAPRRAAQH